MLSKDWTRPDIRVAIYGPSPIFRIGLEIITQRHPQVSVVTSGADYNDLIEPRSDAVCDILIADVTTSCQKSLTALKLFQQLHPNVKIMAFIEPEQFYSMIAPASLNAYCFQVKTSSPEEILSNLEDVYKGKTVVASSLAQAYISRVSQTQSSKMLNSLSQRQTQVLKMIAQGKTNNEIADELRITEPTVKFHVRSIFNRLSVKNRTQAAKMWTSVKSVFALFFILGGTMLEVSFAEL